MKKICFLLAAIMLVMLTSCAAKDTDDGGSSSDTEPSQSTPATDDTKPPVTEPVTEAPVTEPATEPATEPGVPATDPVTPAIGAADISPVYSDTGYTPKPMMYHLIMEEPYNTLTALFVRPSDFDAQVAAMVDAGCVFMFANGIPAMKEIGFFKFLTGTQWAPGNVPAAYGILPMIIGSIYITAGAIILGVPVGILTAVFMAKFCPKKIYRPLKAAIDLLAGIPSVVYGFFGLVVLVPAIRNVTTALGNAFGWDWIYSNGSSILTASILLGIMILPTIVGVSESSIRAVPDSYYEGALALGATHERSVFFTVVPAARSGIMAGVILGIGRAIGETMAVIMVAGNQPRITGNLFKGIRTLTSNIVIEMGYAEGLHREALIATGVVLFVFILIINLLFSLLKRRSEA